MTFTSPMVARPGYGRGHAPIRDLAVIGGGIIGCSAAAFAAERGATVVLFEATEIGAGASGRNPGAVQHPFDPVLAPLYEATLDHYRALADGGFSFRREAGRTPAADR